MSYGTVQAEKMTTESGYSLGAGNSSSFKNRIINGGQVIDQRNAGASVTISGDPGSYITDRWNGYKGGSTNNYTAQQSTTVPTGNFTNSLLITTGTGTSTGSTDYAGIQQKIEGYNFADVGWGTANAVSITASFWVRSSVTGTFGVTFRNSAANATYCGTYVISSANTWTFCSVTVPAYTSGTWVTNNGVGVTFGFDLGVGSTYSGTANQWNTGANYFGVSGTTKLTQTTGATWYVTGVQLEVGTVATSFDFRSYGTELALCQRYYTQFGKDLSNTPLSSLGTGYNSTDALIPVLLPVSMRTQPSYSVSGAELTDFGALTGAVTSYSTPTAQYGLQSFLLRVSQVTGTVTQYRPYMIRATSTSGYIAFSAEL